MTITRIVLTGGPCAGKSTGLAVIDQKLKNLGYRVILMDEMATNVIKSGLTPMDIGLEFQTLLVKLQLDRDKHYEEALSLLDSSEDKIAILYDRGILDGNAYCTKEGFDSVLHQSNVSRNEMLTYYNGVFHLVTAANGARDCYTTANNSARTETPEEAIEKDKLTLDCWVGHPHLRVINNENRNFEQKMTKLLEEIMSLLGEPIPLEIERKFLITMPDIDKLSKLFKVTKSEIVQTYLIRQSEDIERRIRQRGSYGDYSYYYTEKKVVGSGTREEKERKISEREYLTLFMESDTEKHQIRKDRYCFIYKDRYFELDVYPFWKDKAILEIEVSDINEPIELPDCVEVLKEVTDDSRYKNEGLAINYNI